MSPENKWSLCPVEYVMYKRCFKTIAKMDWCIDCVNISNEVLTRKEAKWNSKMSGWNPFNLCIEKNGKYMGKIYSARHDRTIPKLSLCYSQCSNLIKQSRGRHFVPGRRRKCYWAILGVNCHNSSVETCFGVDSIPRVTTKLRMSIASVTLKERSHLSVSEEVKQIKQEHGARLSPSSYHRKKPFLKRGGSVV